MYEYSFDELNEIILGAKIAGILEQQGLVHCPDGKEFVTFLEVQQERWVLFDDDYEYWEDYIKDTLIKQFGV